MAKTIGIVEKIRSWLVKKLIRETDGYTFTGFSEGDPIKFYYQEGTGQYFIGKRLGNFYYGQMTLCGLSMRMSRWLDWSNEKLGGRPVEVDFQTWMYGMLDNIHDQYKREIQKYKGQIDTRVNSQ